MFKQPKFIVLAIACLALAIFVPLYSQQQVPATAAATISGSVTANQGTANATPWNQNLSQYNGSAVGAGNALHVQPGTGAVFTIAALPTGANIVGFVRTIPANTCGTTEYDSGLAFLPSASTQVTATATCVQYLIFHNTDSVNHTVTVQDQSTACNAAACVVDTTYTIGPDVQTAFPWYGTKFTGGLKWNADVANKVQGVIRGNQ